MLIMSGKGEENKIIIANHEDQKANKMIMSATLINDNKVE